jgi:hypothetical protein
MYHQIHLQMLFFIDRRPQLKFVIGIRKRIKGESFLRLKLFFLTDSQILFRNVFK